jgi:hypothetical protein
MSLKLWRNKEMAKALKAKHQWRLASAMAKWRSGAKRNGVLGNNIGAPASHERRNEMAQLSMAKIMK